MLLAFEFYFALNVILITIETKWLQDLGYGPSRHIYYYNGRFEKLKHDEARKACSDWSFRLLAISSHEEKVWFDKHWFEKDFGKHEIWLDYKRTDCRGLNPDHNFCDSENRPWYAYPKKKSGYPIDWRAGEPNGVKRCQNCSMMSRLGFADYECKPRREKQRKTYVCQSKEKYCDGEHIVQLNAGGVEGKQIGGNFSLSDLTGGLRNLHLAGSQFIGITCKGKGGDPRLPNVTSIECGKDGLWTGVKCTERERCPSPSASEFLKPVSDKTGINLTFWEGDKVRVECSKVGFRIHAGLDERECVKNGAGQLNWSGNLKCEAMCSRKALPPLI